MRFFNFVGIFFGALLVLAFPVHAGNPPGISQNQIGSANGVAGLDANGRTPVSSTYSGANDLRVICASVSIGGRTGTATSGAQFGETDRMPCPVIGHVTKVALWIPGQVGSNGQEVNAANTVFAKAALECGATNANPPQFTYQGQSIWAVDPKSTGFVTDTLSMDIPAGTTCYVRFGTFVSFPPVAGTPTAVAGGSLTASSAYKYKISCMYHGVESGPSSEVSVTTGTTTLSASLSWAPNANVPLPCDSYRIYRTAAGGAVNTEGYLTTVAAPGLSFIDTGAIATNPAATPAAAQIYAYNNWLTNGTSTTASNCGGNNFDMVSGSGTFGVTAPLSCATVTPVVLGNDLMTVSIGAISDSIGAGSYIQSATAAFNLSPNSGNWLYAGLPAGTWNFLNVSMPSTRISTFANTALLGGVQRLGAMRFVNYVLSDDCINDIAAGDTWQTVALHHNQVGQGFSIGGKRYVITTCMPGGATTDNMLTQANYTPASYEGQRDSYNLWVRNGMQFNAGTPCNTAGCGTPTPYIYAWFDLAQAMGEVNSAGLPTLNGDYWPTVPTPVYAGQILTGTPTTTVFPIGAGTYTAHALAASVLKITSGAANGQNCIILDNTATSLTCGVGGTPAVTTAPAAGDTLSIFNTVGGSPPHPSLYGYQKITPVFAAWAQTHLTAF